jgi:L-arabinose isomerase
MADLEFLLINDKTDLEEFRKEIRWNDVYYLLSKGL